MQVNSTFGTATRWLGATFAAVSTTFVLVSLHVDSTTSGLIFLVLVVWTATQVGKSASVYSAILCALSFNYYFLPPYHTFRLAGVSEWIAFLSFLASSAVAGRLAERARSQARQAEQSREEMERLYTLSQEMMLFQDAAGLMHELPRMIARIFTLEAVVLYSRDSDECFSSTSDLPVSIQASMSAVSQGQHPTMALPGELMAMPLTVGMSFSGSVGVAARESLARSIHCAHGAGGNRPHSRCGDREIGTARGVTRRRTPAHSAHRLGHARVAYATDVDPSGGDNTSSRRGA